MKEVWFQTESGHGIVTLYRVLGDVASAKDAVAKIKSFITAQCIEEERPDIMDWEDALQEIVNDAWGVLLHEKTGLNLDAPQSEVMLPAYQAVYEGGDFDEDDEEIEEDE
jgi:hypothetical protein